MWTGSQSTLRLLSESKRFTVQQEARGEQNGGRPFVLLVRQLRGLSSTASFRSGWPALLFADGQKSCRLPSAFFARVPQRKRRFPPGVGSAQALVDVQRLTLCLFLLSGTLTTMARITAVALALSAVAGVSAHAAHTDAPESAWSASALVLLVRQEPS